MRKGNAHTIKGKGFDAHPENINRAGYPKGVKNRSTILKQLLDISTKYKNPITGEEKLEIVEAQVQWSLVVKALSGDVQAIKEINDTLYGKIADKTEFKSEGDIIVKLIKGGQH